MNLTSFSVRNWQFTVILFAMLAALGLASWHAVPRLEDPSIDFPTFTVVAVYPGASPTDLERLVVTEIEDRLDQLEHVKSINSRMRDGVATVRVEFEEDQDADGKYDEVVREVNALRPKLPAELARLDIEKATTLEVNIVQVALVSPAASYHVLDSLAEALEDRLAAVPGVREAERWAAPERQVDVELDLGRLAQLRLPVGLVLQAIGGESADIPGGSVEAGLRRYSVRTSGSYETLDQVGSTVLRAGDGRLVRVGDVARVHWSYADSTYRGRFNGRRAVFVTANQQAGITVQTVRDRVYAALDQFAAGLPAGVTLERGFDQAQNVSHRLARLGEDFLIAIALVLVTLLPLGLRSSLIVMISIPLSLAMGLTALYWTGFSLNQLTIVGMVIALGLLVDDSIVVVENIARFRRQGFGRVEAAIAATGQIWVAVLGATATLIAAFVPLLVLPGGPGQFIRSMPAAVIATVLASLFVSVTIIPWLASLLLPVHADPEGNRVLRGFERVIHGTYAPLLDRALRRPRRTLVGAGVVVALSLALVPVVGFSLFPKAETPQLYVSITAPEGASIAATDSAARFAERVIGKRPEVKAIYTSVGHDNPMIYYNIIPRVDNPRVGQLFVLLDTYDQHRTPAMLDTLRHELARYGGAEIALREFENGPPVDAPIALRIVGPDLDTLRAIAGRMEALFEATPGTQYVTNPVRLARTDLRVAIDRGKAGLLGIPTVEIDRTVRLGVAGLEAGTLRERSGDERPIIVRLARAGRAAPGELDRIYVASSSGQLAPLAQVAAVRFERAVSEIQRYDRERAVTVSSSVRTGFNTDRVTKAILGRLDDLHVPAGYRIVPAGEIESREHSFGGVGSAVIVAVFLITAILVLEFRTFRSTLIVASVIPLGLAGGIVALLLAGETLSFTATIGFVALIGIEIKTSILLVDLTNRLRAEGMGLEEAIRKAGEVRFLPIVLTSLTAIGGLSPLALQGSGFYAPLAWVIIGGLVSSTLLARIVTPVLYKVLQPAVQLTSK
ncbi:MAG TPA: efflux RND transporter permease subunit [Gemmatimonadales bacterium]|nr:efflux RND transporter permease subunit [Gemmatimonadales bacterium]